MSPIADMEHQWLVVELVLAIQNVLNVSAGDRIYAGINVSDREDDWLQNYRIPDIAVVLKGNPAKPCMPTSTVAPISSSRSSAPTTSPARSGRFTPRSACVNS